MNEPQKPIDINAALGLSAPDPKQTSDTRNENQAIKQQRTAPTRKPESEVQGETWNVWKTQAQFISRLDTQRAEINKAIEAGAPLEDILLKTIECIAIMTGDQVFLTMNIGKIKNRGKISE